MLEQITYQNTALSASSKHSIIWLHGLGADGNDFLPIAQDLMLPMDVRFIFPHAPTMPVTLNGGYIMRAWYDIYSLEFGSRQDEAGIRRSQADIEALIAQEILRGVPSENILLAGFSQGGAIALQTGLRYPGKLAGILALSTYLPLASKLESERSPANAGIPIFMAHGNTDDIIKPEIANASRKILAALSYPVSWHEYVMSHSVCQDDILDIRRFIIDTL